MKYIIISKPKSGTHLLINVLKNLGIEYSNYRIDTDFLGLGGGVCKYADHIKMYEFKIKTDLSNAINFIDEETFTLGHIDHNLENVKIFKSFKKILLVRDNDEIRSSRIRQNIVFKIKEDKLNLSDEVLNQIEKWQMEEDIFKIEFNDLINKNIDKINKMQIHLFGEIKFNSIDIIEKSLKEPNIMKHPSRPGDHFDLFK
jgi:hypothetical protein